tara:strand:+ start:198 stop:437 length:240 start_codon:yes stop_codon:yes gene_type:complete
MTREELLELIRSVIREYTGGGSPTHNTTDGNEVPSPRPFPDDEEEIENYINKNVYGAEGGHYKKEPAFHNPNRTKFTKF